jgi:phage FluMu gp28-like protein
MFSPQERLAYCDAFIKVNDEPIVLDRWQELYLMDTSPFSIFLKGRQEGFSFAAALKGLIKANDPDRHSYTRQYVSYNFDDAVEKIRAAKMLYESIPKKHRKVLVSNNKTMLEFLDQGGKTTSRLISIACRSPRGRSGDVVFDEFAIFKKNSSRTIYTAALPVLSRGGALETGSTPLGLLGMFSEIWHNKKDYPDFTRFNIPWWQSSALCTDIEAARLAMAKEMDTHERVERFGKKLLKKALTNLFLEDFQQEYECTFIDSAESYISLDLIYANTPGLRDEDQDYMGVDDKGEEKDIEVHAFKTADELLAGYTLENHGKLYLGYDVARRRDAAVIFIIGIMPDGKRKSVANIEMVNQPFEYQRDQIRKIMKSLPVVRGCIDQTGQGEDTTETLQNEFTSARLEGVEFNIRSKEELAIGVREGLEKGQFLLQNDDKFRRQIHSIKRIPTTGGAFRYDSERDDLGHADSFWAWALANFALCGEESRAPNFYEERARNKRQGALQSEAGKPSTSANPILTPDKRGKSLNSALRGLARANR